MTDIFPVIVLCLVLGPYWRRVWRWLWPWGESGSAPVLRHPRDPLPALHVKHHATPER